MFVLSTLCLLAGAAGAQERTLPDRLSPAARTALERLIDSARTVGIPRPPLYDKAAEGVLKGADDERIVHAVQSLARELGDARGAVGSGASTAAITAAASALHAGVSASELKRLAHPAGTAPDDATLATALVTLVDLVAKRVPVDLATSSIQNLIERRATNRQFTALRNDVEQDIQAGRAPEASLAGRLRTLGVPPLQ